MFLGYLISPWDAFIWSSLAAIGLARNLRSKPQDKGSASYRIKKSWLQDTAVFSAASLLFVVMGLYFNYSLRYTDPGASIRAFETILREYAEWTEQLKISSWVSALLLFALLILRRGWATRPLISKQMNRGFEAYKKIAEILALFGVALTSFSFMASRPTGVVGEVQARFQHSRELYADLRRAIRISLEQEVARSLTQRANQTIPENLRYLRETWVWSAKIQ
jgi:hypothetical protein